MTRVSSPHGSGHVIEVGKDLWVCVCGQEFPNGPAWVEHSRQAAVTLADLTDEWDRMSHPPPYHPPPAGWLDFGAHAGDECSVAGRLEWSVETGEDGLPWWERHEGCTLFVDVTIEGP